MIESGEVSVEHDLLTADEHNCSVDTLN